MDLGNQHIGFEEGPRRPNLSDFMNESIGICRRNLYDFGKELFDLEGKVDQDIL